jgi:hypothetical protein
MIDNVNWLRDLLPTDICNARIMSWGYDTRTRDSWQIGGKCIYDHGKTLNSDLCLKRASTEVAEFDDIRRVYLANDQCRVQDVLLSSFPTA